MKLEPGASYTVEVAVTNHSRYAGEPIAADLTMIIAAVVDGTELIPETSVVGHYDPEQTLVYTFPLDIPADAPSSTGAIVVDVRDPNGRRIAQASVPIHVEAAETDNPTITDIFVAGSSDPSDPGNHIYVVLQNVVPDGREFRVQAAVHSESGHYSSGRLANFFNGQPVATFNSLRPDTGVPRDYPYSHITCQILEYAGGPVLATKTIEGPFYYYDPEPDPEPGELRITDIFLADPNNVNEPGRGIFAVLEGVVPDGREFWVRTIAGGHGSQKSTNFFNGVPRYMSVLLRSGYTYEWISIDIWDYQGGPLLTSRILEFDPPYYQE